MTVTLKVDLIEQNDLEQASSDVVNADVQRLAEWLLKLEREDRGEEPEVGDLYLFNFGMEKIIIEWLIADRVRRESEQYYLVIATSGLARRQQDISVPAGQQGGPTIVRPDFGLWIDSAKLERLGQRTGAVSWVVVRKTQERIAASQKRAKTGRAKKGLHKVLCDIRDRAAALFDSNQERARSNSAEIKHELIASCASSLLTTAPESFFTDEFPLFKSLEETLIDRLLLSEPGLNSLFAPLMKLAVDRLSVQQKYLHEPCWKLVEKSENLLRLINCARELTTPECLEGYPLNGNMLYTFDALSLKTDHPTLPSIQQTLQHLRATQQVNEDQDVLRLYRSMQLGYALANALTLIHANSDGAPSVPSYSNQVGNNEKEALMLAQISIHDSWFHEHRFRQSLKEFHEAPTLQESMQALGNLLHKLVFESEDVFGKSTRSPVTLAQELQQALIAKEPNQRCEQLTIIYQKCWLLVNRLCHSVEDERLDIFTIIEELAHIKLALTVWMVSRDSPDAELQIERLRQLCKNSEYEIDDYCDEGHLEGAAFIRRGFLGMASRVSQPESEQRAMPRGLRFQN